MEMDMAGLVKKEMVIINYNDICDCCPVKSIYLCFLSGGCLVQWAALCLNLKKEHRLWYQVYVLVVKTHRNWFQIITAHRF